MIGEGTKDRARVGLLLAGVLCAAPHAAANRPASPAPLAASPASALPGAEPAAPFDVRWGRKKLNLRRLPDDLAPEALAAIERWGEWADETDYHLQLAEDMRLLVVGHKKGSWITKKMDLALEAIEAFDQFVLPVGASAAGSPKGESGARAEAEAPVAVVDDPADDAPFFEELPFGGTLAEARAAAAPAEASAQVEEDLFVPESATAVLVICEEQDAYEALVGDMARRDRELKDWASEAQHQGGFVLIDPPTGAFVLRSEVQEEFNPDNELVNRVAQMMLVRRFGSSVPFWVLQGFAWRVETDVRGAIYCYPYRSDFVGVGEHGGWNTELANVFRAKERGDRPLSVEDFAHWRRGSYQDRYAKISWGLVSWLVLEDPAAFTRFLDDVRNYAHEHNRAALGDGRWERIANYEVPIEFQKETLEKHFGGDLWERATEDFKKRRIK